MPRSTSSSGNQTVVIKMILVPVVLQMLFSLAISAEGEGTSVDQFPQIEAVHSELNTTVGETFELEYLYGIPVNSSDSDVVKTIHILKHGRPRELVCEIVPNGTYCDPQYKARAQMEERPWGDGTGTSYKTGLLVLTLENVMVSDTAVYEGEVRVLLKGYNQSKVSVTVADVPRCPYRQCPDGEWLECRADTNMTCSCTCRAEGTTQFGVAIGSYFGGVATVAIPLLLYKYRSQIRHCCKRPSGL